MNVFILLVIEYKYIYFVTKWLYLFGVTKKIYLHYVRVNKINIYCSVTN